MTTLTRMITCAAALVAGPVALTACADDDAADVDGGDVPAPLAEPILPPTPYDYSPDLPTHFATSLADVVDNTPADNPITDDGATLGRVLFHDTLLSQNQTVACASCHRPTTGFGDDLALSEGFDGGATGRNSMPTLDVRFYRRGRMFWDERAASVEDQVLRPIQDTVEMGLTLDELVDRVAAATYYPPLFEAAFGDDDITSDRIARALAQYVRSIISYQAPWDEGVAQVDSIADDFPSYTDEENRGKAIFFGQHDPATRGLCGSCHMAANPLAAVPPGPGPRPPLVNTALFVPFGATHNGVAELKPPTLRNVAQTAPYMHDGRFDTLEEVVDFYDHEIPATPDLHPALRDADGDPIRLGLSRADRAALVAFLHTLTDPTLATEPRFEDPFVE